MKTQIACQSVFLLGLLVHTGCAPQLMRTPNVIASSAKDPFGDVAPALRSNKVNVLVLTDRASVGSKDKTKHYATGRSSSLVFGSVDVELGKNLSWDELVRESRTQRRGRSLPVTVGSLHEIGHFPATPYPLVEIGKQVKEDPAARSELWQADQALCEELTRRLAENPGRREVFIFVHGVAYSMDESARVLAQLWHFMGRPGVAIAYSWPAGENYAYDRESSEYTIFHFKQLLRSLAKCPAVERVHILAHSRGSDIVISGLRELNSLYAGAGKKTRGELKLGIVALAAADIDMEVASQRVSAERLQTVPERMAFYISEKDRALSLLDTMYRSISRIGQLSPDSLSWRQKRSLAGLPEVEFIDANVSTDFIGHDYFYTNPAVSSDLILLLRDGRAAGAENGRPLIKQDGNFWEIRDDYANPAQPARQPG